MIDDELDSHVYDAALELPYGATWHTLKRYLLAAKSKLGGSDEEEEELLQLFNRYQRHAHKAYNMAPATPPDTATPSFAPPSNHADHSHDTQKIGELESPIHAICTDDSNPDIKGHEMTFQIREPDGDNCTGYMTDGMYEALNGPSLAQIGDTVEVPLRLPEEEKPRKLFFVIRSLNDPGMADGDVILPRERPKTLTEAPIVVPQKVRTASAILAFASDEEKSLYFATATSEQFREYHISALGKTYPSAYAAGQTENPRWAYDFALTSWRSWRALPPLG